MYPRPVASYKGMVRNVNLFAELINCLPVGVLILEPSGRLRFTNRMAKDLMQRGICVGEAQEDLTMFLRSGARSAIHRISCGEIDGHLASYDAEGARVVVIWCVQLDRERLPEALRGIYGLTKQEVRLAIALQDGRSLAEAAGQINIERSTARTHLKNIFAKTRTCRQTQLALLIASCAAAAAVPPVGGCAMPNNLVTSADPNL